MDPSFPAKITAKLQTNHIPVHFEMLMGIHGVADTDFSDEIIDFFEIPDSMETKPPVK